MASLNEQPAAPEATAPTPAPIEAPKHRFLDIKNAFLNKTKAIVQSDKVQKAIGKAKEISPSLIKLQTYKGLFSKVSDYAYNKTFGRTESIPAQSAPIAPAAAPAQTPVAESVIPAVATAPVSTATPANTIPFPAPSAPVQPQNTSEEQKAA